MTSGKTDKRNKAWVDNPLPRREAEIEPCSESITLWRIGAPGSECHHFDVWQRNMKLSGPFQYHLSIASDGTDYRHHPDSGNANFSAPVTTRSPKIYIASVDGTPIYIGQTVQSIRARLRLGFSADGSTGYHGYVWRHHHTEVKLDVWILEGADEDKEILNVETIEAEIVYLMRHHQAQWPAFQTEIHFHPSNEFHRGLAVDIYQHYFPEVP